MSDAVVRKLIEVQLNSWAIGKDYLVAFENTRFDKGSETHLEMFLLPAERRNQFLDGAHRAFTGVVQINVVCPQGEGPGPAQKIADEIDSLFLLNTRLTDSSTGYVLQVVSPCSIARALPRGSMHVLPVSFRYRMDTT